MQQEAQLRQTTPLTYDDDAHDAILSPGLDDELGDVVHLDPDAPLQPTADEDLGAASWCGVDPGAEGGPRSDARPNPVDASHQDVVAAVLGRVVGAAVAWK